MDDDLEFVHAEDFDLNLYRSRDGRFAYLSPVNNQPFYFHDGRLSARRLSIASALLGVDLTQEYRATLPTNGQWLTLIDYRERTITLSMPDDIDPTTLAARLRQRIGTT